MIESLNFKKLGQGPPLIVLHGLFGMLDNWQTMARNLANQYEVWLIDQPNHGKSPHYTDFDYYMLSSHIEKFMNLHEITSANILGHSMGGKTAMQLAMDNSNLIEKLIVVDIAPKSYKAGHDLIFEAFFSVDLAKVENRKQAEAEMAKIIDDTGVLLFLMKNLNRAKDGSYKWKANVQSLFENYSHIIENSLGPFQQFDKPTLFVKGGDSPRYIELDDWPNILEYFPEAKLEIVEGAGHWVHAQKPKELHEIIIDFLGE